MLLLHEILEQAARAAPRREAVVLEDRSVSYAELVERAERFAGLVAARGVIDGARVAFWSTNRPEFPEFLFGSSLAGAVAVPLDHWWTPEDALGAIEQVRPRMILASPPHAESLEPHLPRLASAGVTERFVLDDDAAPGWEPYERALLGADRHRGPAEAGLDAPVLILFTSGSTGRSKGAVHTHRDLAHTAAIMAFELGLAEGERTLHFLPLFSSCLEHLIPLTLVRGTHVILPKFDTGAVWEAAERHAITHFDAVPTVIKRLLEQGPPRAPEALRLVSYASEPMPAATGQAWLDRYPAAGLAQFYGMIEQLCLTILRPPEHPARLYSVGRPMMGAHLRVVGEDGEDVAAGEPGEVLARTPTLMQGYFGDPAATARVVVDGWMRTGDLGRFDQDGYLVLEGRLKEIIKSGGVTVVPREVEEVLLGHPSVLEAAVIGRPDQDWGEAVHAFAVLRPGATAAPEELRAFCRASLAGYKCPREVHVVAELPRTGIGKIARRRLPLSE